METPNKGIRDPLDRDKTYLYRLCRPDEDPSKGLEARDPTANGVSISSHIRGKRRSPYISTTATIECIQMFIGSAIMEGSKPGKVVRIDFDKLKQESDIEIIDLNSPEIIGKSVAKVYAKGRANIAKYKEILLKGRIPPHCIEVLEDIENPAQHEIDDYTSSDEDYQDEPGMNGSPRQSSLTGLGEAAPNMIVNDLNEFKHFLKINTPRQAVTDTDILNASDTNPVTTELVENAVIYESMKGEDPEKEVLYYASPLERNPTDSEDELNDILNDPVDQNRNTGQNAVTAKKLQTAQDKRDDVQDPSAINRADIDELFETDDVLSDDGSEIEILGKDEATRKLEILTEKYKNSLETFITRRESTIQVLRELVDQLNDCRTRGNISKISGASVSIVGALAAVASIPLTGGLSAVALTAGSLFSIGGGIAGIGGEVYINTCEKDYMKRANLVLKYDQEEAERLDQAGYELKSHVSHMSQIGVPEVQMFRILTTAYTNTMVAFRLLEVSETIAEIGKVTGHAATGIATAGKVTQNAASGITKAGHLAKGTGAFVSVVFIPLDIWQIVNSSWELTSDNCEKAQMIANVITDLENDLAEKKGFLHKGTNSKDSKGIDPTDLKDIASADEKVTDTIPGKTDENDSNDEKNIDL